VFQPYSERIRLEEKNVKSIDASQVNPTRANAVEDLRLVTTVNLEPCTSSLEEIELTYRCPRQDLAAALSVIGGKWKALIVCELSRRSMRYHEIDAALSYVSHRVLTYELQVLIKGGVISRSKRSESLRAHYYSLTTRGYALYTIIQDLVRWARLSDS
jgi:DNA-binding HxlR family transcriptional regulator